MSMRLFHSTPASSATVSMKRRLANLATHATLLVASAVMLYPFVIILLTAFKSNTEVYLNPYGLPRQWAFGNFVEAWTRANLGQLFINSIVLTSVSTVLAMFCSSLAAYGLTRTFTRLQPIIYLFLVSGIFIPIQLSIIPLFKIVKDLHLFNTYAGVICVYIAGGIPLGVFLITTFMRGLPGDVIDAATIDGCSYFGLYRRIYLPLVRPILVTYIILEGLAVWNDFLVPLLLITDPNGQTLTTGILSFKQQYLAQWGYLMAGIAMMILPIVIAYIFLQRYILKGITGGAVKG